MNDRDLVLQAISFAARAHRHQLRKDGMTPYAAHTMRVLFMLRDRFGVSDPVTLTAAVLHDTIEDTPTDFDDLAERFGVDVARIVAALTKEMRLPDEEREAKYLPALIAGGTPVILCKLADIYDNLLDSHSLSPAALRKSLARAKQYLDFIQQHLPEDAQSAFDLVARTYEEVRKSAE